MRQMRSEVFRLDNLAALGELRVRIAHRVHHFPRLARRLLQFFLIVGGVVRRVAPLSHSILRLLAPFECGKGVVRNHRHSAQRLKRVRRFERIDRNRLLHADYFQRR